MTILTLTPDTAGERLDSYLAQNVPDLTRSAAQKLLEKGSVLVDGRPAKKNEKTSAAMTIQVSLPDPEPVDILPQNIPAGSL